ncbi:hypothetical protein [Exiguobacterium sp. MH3]|uniref:hypothetical protein n=1 Tax=Exiguobacterium sp. MH3 TaxID=1399115 RepID=UPI0003C405D8|nr:hypothetical protein [Exiguobacterium sp. MH3]AHA31285.1 hypothetical protein U719_06530 [Exiguobacterium sp. MH3]
MKDEQAKKVEKTSIERLKEQYPGLNIASGRYKKTRIGVDWYIVQESDGLRFVEEKDGTFVLVEKVKWDALPEQMYLDELFLKSFYYSDEKEKDIVLTIARAYDGDEIRKEIQKQKQIILKKRKAIQKVLGFRSGSIWKSAIAISVYALMLLFVVGLFVGNEEEAVAKPETIQKEKTEISNDKEVSKPQKPKKEEMEIKTPKKQSITSFYKKIGNDYIFKTQKVEKNFSALNESNHTIMLRVKPIGGSLEQIHSQSKHLAASVVKEALDKDKKLDQLALFIDDENGIFIVKYVFDKNSLMALNDSRTSDGYILKDNIEKLASSVTLTEELR